MSSPDSLDFYDAELCAHHQHLRAAYGIGPGDEVVDIGCGTGLTTREAARAAAPGRVLGIDVSERMLERARQLTAAERLDNVRYELGDAQMHRFDPAGFDVAISRFGTMFFSDPAAAFANIAAALRPDGRLVLLVWQRHEHNEWARAIDAALGDAAEPPQPGADPFSLGDRSSGLNSVAPSSAADCWSSSAASVAQRGSCRISRASCASCGLTMMSCAPTVPSPSPAPAPLFVNRGRHSMPAPRRTEQSSSASASLPATSTETHSSTSATRT